MMAFHHSVGEKSDISVRASQLEGVVFWDHWRIVYHELNADYIGVIDGEVAAREYGHYRSAHAFDHLYGVFRSTIGRVWMV